MNPGEFSVKHNRVILVAMAMAILGGIVAYLNIGRLEDPEFTIHLEVLFWMKARVYISFVSQCA